MEDSESYQSEKWTVEPRDPHLQIRWTVGTRKVEEPKKTGMKPVNKTY